MKNSLSRRLPPLPEEVVRATSGNAGQLSMATDVPTSVATSRGTSELLKDAEKELEHDVLQAALYRETTSREAGLLHTRDESESPELDLPQTLRTPPSLASPLCRESGSLEYFSTEPLGNLPPLGVKPPAMSSESTSVSWAAPRTSPRRLGDGVGKSITPLIYESRSPSPMDVLGDEVQKTHEKGSPGKASSSCQSPVQPQESLPARRRGRMSQYSHYSVGEPNDDPWGCVAEQLKRLTRNVEVLTRQYRSKESDAPSKEMQQAFVENCIDYADKRPSVEVTVEVSDVSDFDLATGHFHAEFKVSLDWEEPEFKEGVHYFQNQRTHKFEVSNIVLEDSQAFNPHIDILNAAEDMKIDAPDDYHIHRLINRGSREEPSVWLSKEYKCHGTLKCPHPDGTHFPWDMQRLPIQVKSRPMEGQTTLGKDREIRLVEPSLKKMEVLERAKAKRRKSPFLNADEFASNPMLPTIEAHKWSMVDKMSIGTDKTVPNFNIGELEVCAFGGSDPMPDQYYVEIVVIRAWTTYIFDFIIQMLLVTISLCTAWVPFNEDTTINKLSISMTIVLAIVFFATTKPPAIQNLTYNTLQDTWDVCMLGATVIVCIENVFVYIQCYGMDRSEYEDWVLGVGSFLSQGACEESKVGASTADSWFVLLMLIVVLSTFFGMLIYAAVYRLRFLLNVKDDLESCDLTVDDQIGWQTSLWQTPIPAHLKDLPQGDAASQSENLKPLDTAAATKTDTAGFAPLLGNKMTLPVKGKTRLSVASGVSLGLNPEDKSDQLVHCIARHGMPILYIFPRFWLSLAKGMCRCRCRCRCSSCCRRTEANDASLAQPANFRGSTIRVPAGTRGSILKELNEQNRAEGEEPPDQTWLENFVGLRPVLPRGETVRILDCGTGEVGFYEYCWRAPTEGAKELLYSDKSTKMKLDTTKTFIEEFVFPQDGPERFANEIHKRFFPKSEVGLRSPPTDSGLSSLNPGFGTLSMAATATMAHTMNRKKTKIFFGPTGQNRQRLIQSKQSALAVEKWVEKVEEILNQYLANDRTGIVTDMLLFIPSDHDEATYELVAAEYLVQHADLSVRSLQTDAHGAPFAGFELSQAMSRAGTRRKNGGANILSLMDFLREFQDLMDQVEINQDFMVRIFRSASYEEGYAEAQPLVKAIRESEPLMRSLIKNRLFNGTLSAGGGSCQITVKPDHEERMHLAGAGRLGTTSPQPGINRHGSSSSSNQVVRTSEFQSIPVGNKTPLTADTLGYALWPRTEPMTEDKIGAWKDCIRGAIRDMDCPPKMKGSLRGVYIGISAVYHAAKAAGCAEELLPKAVFVERLNDKLQRLLEDPPKPQMKKGEEVYDHRDFSNILLVKMLVSSVLADTAWIVCKREWRAQPASLLELSTDDINLPQYVATWSFGFYLSQSN